MYFHRPRGLILIVLILLGSLLLLEMTVRFIYYQRNGRYPAALIHAISFLAGSSDDSAPEIKKGRWRPVGNTQNENKLTDEQKYQIEQLRSIGNVAGSQIAPQNQNVTIYDRKLACHGLNFVVSGHGPEAFLMDMSGHIIHKWHCEIFRAWPDFDPEKFLGKQYSYQSTFWRRAHIMENGDLFAIFEGVGLIKLDKHSNIIWRVLNSAHHDLYIDQEGKIYVLTRKAHINKNYNPKEPILEDFISILDPKGIELEKTSILEALENSPFAPVLTRGREFGDIFHSNTIELIEKQPPGFNHPLKQGTLLISILRLDFICAIDPVKKSVYWGASDYWNDQHQPTLLSNGNILILDNKGRGEKSTVFEFDLASREIKWFYRGSEENPFYTATCGSCQRLQNGNTLITESDSGRVFEVTPEKQIVWEYINPYRVGKNNELIASLFEVVRLRSDFPTNWLERDTTY
jgi:hypothetical protein